MAKGESKTANTMIKDEKNRVNTQVGSYADKLSSERDAAVKQNNDERTSTWDTFNGMAGDAYGGLSQEVINNIRSTYGPTKTTATSGGGGSGSGSNKPATPASGIDDWNEAYNRFKTFADTGGVDESKMRAGESTFKDLMNNGGYSSDRLAQINDAIGGLQTMGQTGGLDDEAINRFRGNGVYDEFATTGGYSDADKANYRKRANSTAQANFGQTLNELNRSRALNGGYSPNLASSIAKAARQNAYGVSTANAANELALSDAVNKGRQWGATGMTDAENTLQSLKTKNMLEGMTGAGNMGISLQDSINNARNSGATGITNMEHGIQSLISGNKLAGTTGMGNLTTAKKQLAEQAASRAASASAARAAQDLAERRFKAQSEQWIGAQQMQGNQFGATGKLSTYTATPGLTSMYNDDLLGAMGLQSQANNGLINAQVGNKGQGTNWGGMLSGAGNLLTGLGGFGKSGSGNNGSNGNGSNGQSGPQNNGGSDYWDNPYGGGVDDSWWQDAYDNPYSGGNYYDDGGDYSGGGGYVPGYSYSDLFGNS